MMSLLVEGSRILMGIRCSGNKFAGMGQATGQSICGPGKPGSKHRRRVVVSRNSSRLAADDTAEHRSSLVVIERVARGASCGKQLLSSMRLGLGRGDEAREILGLFGLRRAKERVGKRDRADVLSIGILGQPWVDEEIDRHVDLLMRIEPLIVKAEALDLLEIDPRLLRRHIERRVSDDRLIAEILGREKDELVLAEAYLDLPLRRLEAPRQVRRNAGVK